MNGKDLLPSDKCAAVTRLNNALFNPRLHFDCPEPLNGRYLYIKATGAVSYTHLRAHET